MTELAVLGVIRSYADLHQLMRWRADALEITRARLDEIAGLQEGYSAKLLSPSPMKKLGDKTLGYVLPALAMKLVAVVDEEALARIKNRLTPRLLPSVLGTTLEFKFSRKELKRRQRAGGRKRIEKMTKEQLSEHARHMNKMRWHKPKITEVTK